MSKEIKIKKPRKKVASLKQARTVQALESGEASTLAEAGRIAGYSEITLKGSIYRLAKQPGSILYNYIQQRYTKEGIDLDIQKLEKECEAEKDRSVQSRMLELRCKIAGLTRDSGNSLTLVGDDVLSQLMSRLSDNVQSDIIDITNVQSDNVQSSDLQQNNTRDT